MRQIALTTSDNPYSPITHFDQWYSFDYKEKHYDSCGYLARMAKTSSALSDPINEEIIERAIDDIVKENLIGLLTNYEVNYQKVVKE